MKRWVYSGIGVIVVASLIIPLPKQSASQIVEALWLWFHFGAWYFLCWIALEETNRLQNQSIGRLAYPWWLLVGLFFAVALLEMLQEWTGRNPSVQDMCWGWLGVSAAMSHAMLRGMRSATLGLRRTAASLWLLLAFIAAYPLGVSLLDRRMQHREFPVLYSGQSTSEVNRWQTYGVSISSRSQGGSIRLGVRLDDAVEYPGVFMRVSPRDWSDRVRLVVQVRLDDVQPLKGWVRIIDYPEARYHDRFQKELTLQAGMNEVYIEWGSDLMAESGRVMSLERVYEWGMFFHKRDAGREIEILRAWLE